MAGDFKVRLTQKASEELDSILMYLLANYGEKAARQGYEAINQKFEAIEKMPTAYPLYLPDNRVFKRSYRYIIAKNAYRIIYTILMEKEIARVITIRHVKSDPGLTIRAVEEG